MLKHIFFIILSIIITVIELKKYKYLILNIIIALGVGGLSALVTYNSMSLYQNINKPDLAPPGFIFPIVWSILYILMGTSSYLLHRSDHPNKETALIIYYFQLLINFSWPITFFNYQNYLLALVILLVLNILIILLIRLSYPIKPLSAYLLLPYLAWTLFALYLNFWLFIHN